MGNLGGNRAIRYLHQVLDKGRPVLGGWAALGMGLALRTQPDKKVLPQLQEVMKTHPDPSVRGGAAVALGLARSREAVVDLISMMKVGDDPLYRGYCAFALGMINDPVAVEPLRNVFRQESPIQLRILAAQALALMNEIRATEDWVSMLVGVEDVKLKAYLAMSLDFLGAPEVVTQIQQEIQKTALDDKTLHCLIPLSCKLLSGRKGLYLEPLAAGSDFMETFPYVDRLLAMDL
jgi:hypothetical protein